MENIIIVVKIFPLFVIDIAISLSPRIFSPHIVLLAVLTAVIFSLSAPIRYYDYVSTVIFFHHRDTEDTEGIFVLPIGRRRWAKKSIRWMKMPNLCKVARTISR
jgi:hypothetical protein